MAFNFKKLASTGAISSITDPVQLFDALPNKADGYGYIRAVQESVLDSWSTRRDDRDVVIKTNTGGGKTVVGLLMLQCSLHEKKGPALYLAPDPHLAKRVCEEANNLGLTIVEDPLSSRFLSGEAICITTMRTLVNGKTRFGLVGNSNRQPLKIGTIVVDDAHAAIALVEETTQLVIPKTHDAYNKLLSLFEDDLKSQGLNAYMDVLDGDRSAVLRVPFWSWQDKQEAVLETLRPYRTDSDFEWSWPLVNDLLSVCQAVVSSDEFEIMPPCPPIEKFPSFADAKRRIYLTATLADDSVLVTHFDADPVSVSTSIVPKSAADLGDRLVLSPQELNPDIDHDELRDIARTVAETHNVVILVPSKKQAKKWDDEADLTVSTADDISDAVERLKSVHVGLVVIINRYDGIDLPDDACRLLIIDSLPMAFSGIERREAVALRDSDAMVTRQLQRLEQGMGRGVRSREDRCVVLLIGPRLTQLVARADIADRLSPATQAQLQLSRRVAAELEGGAANDFIGVIMQVIEGDSDFRLLSREAVLNVTYGPAVLSPTATPLRRAYVSAASGRIAEAARYAETAVTAAKNAGDDRLAGWLGETHASYLGPVDSVAAQNTLHSAALLNSAVIRPLEGISYQKVTSASTQAEQAVLYLDEKYATGAELIVGINAVLSSLDWDNDRTDEAEDAFADIALHLGIMSQQPERDYGIGSDVLWSFGNNCYAVIEAKTGATAPLIWKKDINQLAGSVNWCSHEYGDNSVVWPVIVHPSNTIERTGTPPTGTRVMTKQKLKGFKNAVRLYIKSLAQDDGYRNATLVDKQLAYQKLTYSTLFEEYTVGARREPKNL